MNDMMTYSAVSLMSVLQKRKKKKERESKKRKRAQKKARKKAREAAELILGISQVKCQFLLVARSSQLVNK